MRIGLVIYGDIDTPTGGYLYDRMLVKTLRSSGHRVEIVSQNRKPYVENIPDNFSDETYVRLREMDPDILLEDELNHISLFYLNRRLRGEMNFPMVSIVHHLSCSAARSEADRRMFEHFEKAYLRTVDGFVFNSEATKRSVTEVIGLETRGVVAHPGKDHLSIVEPMRMEEKPEWPFGILYLGNIVPHKGLDILVRSLSQVTEQDYELTVIGNPLDRAFMTKVEGLVKELGISDRVKILGFVDDCLLQHELRRNHLLCVPSFFEGYGIVYTEAMGYGLPVIATNAGGAAEIVTDGVDGFLIDPGDGDRCSFYLDLLMRDRSILRRMSDGAFDRFQCLPTWEQSTGDIEMFLRSFIE